jgi:hypothetical protein
VDYATRKRIYRTVERDRGSKLLTFVTSDRVGMETQIAQDCIDLFVDLLDQIGPTSKISLLLHTNGGQTSAAWRLINLIRTFCDELEVLIPLKAFSAGTLISLGADNIVMTKQAALGPIDPSLTHPLNPPVPVGNQIARVPVSVEAVRGYLDAIKDEFHITDQTALAGIVVDLSNKIHPLVLGEIFRSRAQIRFLADKLIRRQVADEEKIKKIIDFLCADSGSHDYTMNRREAHELGLKIEKPSPELYRTLRKIHLSYAGELKLIEPYSPQVLLGTNATVNFSLVRGLVESMSGCYAFLSEGALTRNMTPGPPGGAAQEMITDQRTFEGWRKVA